MTYDFNRCSRPELQCTSGAEGAALQIDRSKNAVSATSNRVRFLLFSCLFFCGGCALLAQEEVAGCTYPWACNYDADASVDDGSCLLPPVGCPWPENASYVGCTYQDAMNYSPDAVWDNGSCAYEGTVVCPTDINGDGTTEIQDMLMLLGAFGSGCVAPGSNMLLIGNSFFRPYADNLDVVATDAGYGNHNSTIITRGGENGWPSSFWNDSTTQESLTIKAALDAGGVELFAMTPGGDPTDPIAGHKAWINYALQNNPDIVIGIALPPVDFPASWDSTAQSYGYTNIHDFYPAVVDNWHTTIVDSLRVEFPGINIFSIPTGWAAIELAQMQQDELLEDDIDLFGAKPTSIFTDDKGHQGQIVIEAGTLVWLASIYGDDLSLNNYDTGFLTDLHGLAIQIMDNHPADYKQ